MGREQEEEKKRRNLEKVAGRSQNGEMEEMDYEQSLVVIRVGQGSQGGGARRNPLMRRC
jgi:hypothetical protein